MSCLIESRETDRRCVKLLHVDLIRYVTVSSNRNCESCHISRAQIVQSDYRKLTAADLN